MAARTSSYTPRDAQTFANSHTLSDGRPSPSLRGVPALGGAAFAVVRTELVGGTLHASGVTHPMQPVRALEYRDHHDAPEPDRVVLVRG